MTTSLSLELVSEGRGSIKWTDWKRIIDWGFRYYVQVSITLGRPLRHTPKELVQDATKVNSTLQDADGLMRNSVEVY